MNHLGTPDLFHRFEERNESARQLQDFEKNLADRRNLKPMKKVILSSTAIQEVHKKSCEWMDDIVAIFQKQVRRLDAWKREEFFAEQSKSTEPPTPYRTIEIQPISTQFEQEQRYNMQMSMYRYLQNHPLRQLAMHRAREGTSARHFSYQDSHIYGGWPTEWIHEAISLGGRMSRLAGRRSHYDEPRSAFTYEDGWEKPESIFDNMVNDRDYVDFLMGRIDRKTYELRKKIEQKTGSNKLNNKTVSFVLEKEY